MRHSRGVGGSAEHDLRREGTVTPPDHNLGRSINPGTAEEKLANPDRPHSSPSAREERRARERAEPDPDAEPADSDEGR